jgi:hypothetical protein
MLLQRAEERHLRDLKLQSMFYLIAASTVNVADAS